jgi:phosphate transport system protein
VQLALSIKQRDKELDQLNADLSERLIEEITQSRVDVRVYLAMIHIGRHLERVGDHAKNIAEDAVFAASAADIRHLHGDRARL